MSNLHTFTATFETTRPDGHITGSIEVIAHYHYTPGHPATPPAYSHGGLPPDPPEIAIERIELEGGAIRVTAEDDAFYTEWMFDNHFDRMCEEAEADRADARTEAAERRAEQRREDRLERKT